MLTDKEQGAHDCRSYYGSQAYGSLTRNVKAEDAIKIFKPPVIEALVQFVTPLPKDRQDWIAGFNEEQANRRLQDKSGLV